MHFQIPVGQIQKNTKILLNWVKNKKGNRLREEFRASFNIWYLRTNKKISLTTQSYQ